jgi:D-2-hydroxyacid dehydrogenase (NADP+)
VVNEPALADALARRQIRGFALDVMVEEPLSAASPLWALEHVLITPHTAGETCRYEDSVAVEPQTSRRAKSCLSR